MKKVVSILVAGAVFVVTGVSSVLVNTWSETQQANVTESSRAQAKQKGFSFGKRLRGVKDGKLLSKGYGMCFP